VEWLRDLGGRSADFIRGMERVVGEEQRMDW
jgi:hypothetical protein